MRFFCLTTAMLLACLPACAGEAPPAPSMSEVPLMATIPLRPALTVDEGYRVFLCMARDHGRFDANLNVRRMSFDDVRAHLAALCVISPRWNLAPGDCLRRDVVAYMSASYLGIRPGLLTGLFGMTKRYAHRELMFRRIVAPGSPKTVVSGSEMLSVMTRISICLDPHQDVQLDPDEIH